MATFSSDGLNDSDHAPRLPDDPAAPAPPVPIARVQTVTTDDQRETENLVLQHFRDFLANAVDDSAIQVFRDRHIPWLRKGSFLLPKRWSSLDASRPWFCFWISHALELLGDDDFVEQDFAPRMAFFLENFCLETDMGGVDDVQSRASSSVPADHDEDRRLTSAAPPTEVLTPRGLAGGPHQLPHLAPTYSGIMALVIGGTPQCYDLLRRHRAAIYLWLLRRKDPSGGFLMHESGELDMRGCYCAIAVASTLQILTPELAEGVCEYVCSHQRWDGGIAGVIGGEAHGGYNYCGLAALAILGKADLLNLGELLHWLCGRQFENEGGFGGRINKLVDSCYSFWQGACFGLVRAAWEVRILNGSGRELVLEEQRPELFGQFVMLQHHSSHQFLSISPARN